MDIVILVAAMIIVGLVVGWIAGFIWKDNRPIGVRGDYIAAVIAAIVIGLIDWFIIPAMGFSDSLRNIGVVLLGNFELQEPSKKQLATMTQLVPLLRSHFRVKKHRIYGHKDLGQTACPGKHLYAHVNKLKK